MTGAPSRRAWALELALGGGAAALIALAASAPWLFGFSAETAAISSGLPFALAFIPIALLATAMRPAALVLAVGGAWLVVTPWLLGYSSAGVAAWLVDGLVGIALIAIAVVLSRTDPDLDLDESSRRG